MAKKKRLTCTLLPLRSAVLVIDSTHDDSCFGPRAMDRSAKIYVARRPLSDTLTHTRRQKLGSPRDPSALVVCFHEGAALELDGDVRVPALLKHTYRGRAFKAFRIFLLGNLQLDRDGIAVFLADKVFESFTPFTIAASRRERLTHLHRFRLHRFRPFIIFIVFMAVSSLHKWRMKPRGET